MPQRYCHQVRSALCVMLLFLSLPGTCTECRWLTSLSSLIMQRVSIWIPEDTWVCDVMQCIVVRVTLTQHPCSQAVSVSDYGSFSRWCSWRYISRVNWRLCSSGMLRGVGLWLFTEVSGHPIDFQGSPFTFGNGTVRSWTSVNSCQPTLCNIPEESKLHSQRVGSLKHCLDYFSNTPTNAHI